VPESEAAPEPVAERPFLLARLTSWRAPQEPEEDTPAAPAREEAGSPTQIRAPEAAEARAKSVAAAADEESGAAEKSGAAWRPAYALALAAALVVCGTQLVALMTLRHWSRVIFELSSSTSGRGYGDRIHWDVAYDLWGWDAAKTLRGVKEESEGSSCSAPRDRKDPGRLGGTACAARNAARAGTIICLALAFMVSGVLAKWFRHPALTTRGKSRWWWLKATGGALAVGGAVALGTALFYLAAHEKALNSRHIETRNDAAGECSGSECRVVRCSEGCVIAIAGGALALFAGCAMAVYAGCCYDFVGFCCPACCHPKRGPDGRYRIEKPIGI
jgi:hypothetical protein